MMAVFNIICIISLDEDKDEDENNDEDEDLSSSVIQSESDYMLV